MSDTLPLLGLLQEECAEVIQIASKIRRFGMESYHPSDPYRTNQTLLEQEIGDMLAIIGLLIKNGTVNADNLHRFSNHKLQRLRKYGEVKIDG